MNRTKQYVFTSESVTEGHPDKVCDFIADSVLDTHLTGDRYSRVACEVLCKTSHDVVAVVRRMARGMKVGHTGTLDPLASGVLPLVLGKATRLAQFFSAADKEYAAELALRGVRVALEGNVRKRLAQPLARVRREKRRRFVRVEANTVLSSVGRVRLEIGELGTEELEGSRHGPEPSYQSRRRDARGRPW